MLKRLANTGLNVGVLLIAVAVFIVSFLALTALGAAQKPPTLTIPAAGRDLSIGEVLTPTDTVQKTVFKDDNTCTSWLINRKRWSAGLCFCPSLLAAQSSVTQ
jgi:hypothetical protein